MARIIPVYKPVGPTSTAIVEIYKEKLQKRKVVHTGALDPMAEGVLLIAIDVETQDELQNLVALEKSYEYEGLFGFTTDTWDVLGLIMTNGLLSHDADLSAVALQGVIANFNGTIVQQVPVFSNMFHKKKRMYKWAREGLSHKVPPLFRERTVYEHTFLDIEDISLEGVLDYVTTKIAKVSGDFRQEEIRQNWERVVSLQREHVEGNNLAFCRWKGYVRCEKGTYVRSIVNSIGRELGVGATTWSIKRTSVGSYTVNDCETLE